MKSRVNEYLQQEFTEVPRRFNEVKSRLEGTAQRWEKINVNMGTLIVRLVGLEKAVEAHIAQGAGGAGASQTPPAGRDALQDIASASQVRRLAEQGEVTRGELREFGANVMQTIADMKNGYVAMQEQQANERKKLNELQQVVEVMRVRESGLQEEFQGVRHLRNLNEKRIELLEGGKLELKAKFVSMERAPEAHPMSSEHLPKAPAAPWAPEREPRRGMREPGQPDENPNHCLQHPGRHARERPPPPPPVAQEMRPASRSTYEYRAPHNCV